MNHAPDAMTPMMPFEEVKHLRKINAELLEALKALYEAQKYVKYDLGMQVRAAIAKAEGCL